jgi:ABC-type transporter MlaC component
VTSSNFVLATYVRELSVQKLNQFMSAVQSFAQALHSNDRLAVDGQRVEDNESQHRSLLVVSNTIDQFTVQQVVVELSGQLFKQAQLNDVHSSVDQENTTVISEQEISDTIKLGGNH